MPLHPLSVAADLVGVNPAATPLKTIFPSLSQEQRHGAALVGNEDPAWETLAQDDSISIYRKKAWKEIIELTYGHTGTYLAAFDRGTLIDILPFFLVKDPLGRKKLISTPYQGSNGGFMCQDPGVRQDLIEKAMEFARAQQVQYVEIRSINPVPELEEAGFIVQKPFLVSILPLSRVEENWQRLTPKHRRNVRHAARSGVDVQKARNYSDMQVFYDMLADHYKRLGIPFLGEKFFRLVWERLLCKDCGSLLIARHQGEIIGGHLMLFNGKTMVSKFSVTRHHDRYAKLYSAYALYWEAIRIGVERGLTAFDLGITGAGNVGLREFKTRLGAEEKPLHFYYYRLKGELPDYESYYSAYKLPRLLWKHAPAWLTNRVGNLINTWIC
nr:conserved hypothetical protein PF0797 [uncultured bacterium]